MRTSLGLALFVSALGAACQLPQYAPPPNSAPPPTRTTSSAPGVAAAPPSAPAAAPAAPAPMIPTTVEIHNDCSTTVPVFYGEKPGFSSGKKSSVSSNTTTTEGRNPDGTLTMWIIDDHENGLASVRITPSTRRVEIDSSCKSLRAQ